MNAPLERAAAQPHIDEILSRMDAIVAEQRLISSRQETMENNLARNSEMTAEIIEFFQAGKGAFKVLGWIGSGVKWMSAVSIAAGALWYLVTHGFPPSK